MAYAFKCSDQSAKQVARQLWDKYFCNITDYDSHVRMRDDLKEALAAAQVNANLTWQHQPDLFNRGVKGADIEEGDQVLLANRCVCGR